MDSEEQRERKSLKWKTTSETTTEQSVTLSHEEWISQKKNACKWKIPNINIWFGFPSLLDQTQQKQTNRLYEQATCFLRVNSTQIYSGSQSGAGAVMVAVLLAVSIHGLEEWKHRSDRLLEQIKRWLTDPIVTQVSSQALLLVLGVILSLPQLELLTREPHMLRLPLQRETDREREKH